MSHRSDQIKKSDPLWIRIVSGSVGSMITALVVTPLEVVKVRQQFQTPTASEALSSAALKNVEKCPSCGVFVFNNGLKECFLPRNAVPYFDPITGSLKPNPTVSSSKGTLSMLRSIYQTEGISGIYAGLTPTLVMGIPNTVLYFASYEDFRERLNQHGIMPVSIVPAVAGASARLVASCATAPLELIKTRQAAQVGGGQAANGLWADVAHAIQSDGFLSLYRGLGPTLLRDIPFSAVYWYFIETFRASWGDSSHLSSMEQAGQALVNGSAAGMISAAVTTPLDVVKTRRQVTTSVEMEVTEAAICDHHGSIAYEAKRPISSSTSTISTMKQIVAEEGVSGLWRGNQTRMIKVAPACAIMLSSYEIGKRRKRLLSETV
eukprot:CAMPEP_0176029342 /NCGR_PEP_ID=MMETSP0120_2-20121206/14417_1 /TAXON_ID=160619 /ORGANISM="Kryptoperidinium foliaceum, Strain CCMP 1326" /LENGTH=376 /DNA_ID=CAMNT_0017362567 /DNA_START=119 /DNA_END=1249 /DNA_ORIENTATION=-